jgi:hypothetical protein
MKMGKSRSITSGRLRQRSQVLVRLLDPNNINPAKLSELIDLFDRRN